VTTGRPLLRGVLASALGTLAMDGSVYRRYRQDGGDADFPGQYGATRLLTAGETPSPDKQLIEP